LQAEPLIVKKIFLLVHPLPLESRIFTDRHGVVRTSVLGALVGGRRSASEAEFKSNLDLLFDSWKKMVDIASADPNSLFVMDPNEYYARPSANSEARAGKNELDSLKSYAQEKLGERFISLEAPRDLRDFNDSFDSVRRSFSTTKNPFVKFYRRLRTRFVRRFHPEFKGRPYLMSSYDFSKNTKLIGFGVFSNREFCVPDYIEGFGKLHSIPPSNWRVRHDLSIVSRPKFARA
jgi:hypothetical protein